MISSLEKSIAFLRGGRATIMILAAIVFLGAGLRIYKIDVLSFNADEFLDINATYGYARTGVWQAWDFNTQRSADRQNQASDERAWPYRWQVAQVFRHFPPTEAAARSVSVVWGVMSILVVAFVAYAMTGSRSVLLVAAFLFAVSPMSIEYSRTLRMYAMFFPVFLLFSWALFRLLEPHGKALRLSCPLSRRYGCLLDARFLLPVIVLGVLSILLHQLTSNILFTLGVYVVFWAIYLSYCEKKFKNKYLFFLSFGALAFVATYVFFTDNVRRAIGQLVFFEDHVSYVWKVLGDFSHPFLAFLAISGGIFFLWKESKRKESVWLASSLIAILFAAVFLWKRNVGTQYIYFAQSFAFILAASGMVFFAKFVRSVFPGKKASVFFITIFLSILLLPDYGYYFRDGNAYDPSPKAQSPNYRSVFSYFLQNRQDGEVLITRDFRNYYFHDSRVDVYDFGGELSQENFSISELRNLLLKYPHGWIIYSDNDERYMTKEVRFFIEDNFQKERDSLIRGDVAVYRW